MVAESKNWVNFAHEAIEDKPSSSGAAGSKGLGNSQDMKQRALARAQDTSV